MGGSGSTFLKRWLHEGLGLGVDHKPDTIYRRHWQADFGVTDRVSEFRSRSDFEPPLDGSACLDSIDRYLNWIITSPNRTAILNTWPEQHVLRHLTPRRYVFLIREPADAYASYCEPSRHGDVADRYGGSESWLAVQFAERWRKIAEEYLSLAEIGWNPILWRYEDLHAQLPPIGGLSWSAARPVNGRLSECVVDLIRLMTSDAAAALETSTGPAGPGSFFAS